LGGGAGYVLVVCNPITVQLFAPETCSGLKLIPVRGTWTTLRVVR